GPAARADAGAELDGGVEGVHPADTAAGVLGEPEVAVRPGGDPPGPAAGCDADGGLRHHPLRRDARDAVRGVLGEPEVAIRAAGGDGGAELGDDVVRRDAADMVAGVLGEPEVAVRSHRDAGRPAASGDALAELSYALRPGGRGSDRGQAEDEHYGGRRQANCP